MAVQLHGHCIIQTGWMDGEKGEGEQEWEQEGDRKEG